MDYTFAIDTAQLDTLVTSIKETHPSTMEGLITTTFDTLSAFDNDTWSGSSYDDFKTGCQAYEPALKTLPDVLKCFGEALQKASTDGATLVTDVQSIVNGLG